MRGFEGKILSGIMYAITVYQECRSKKEERNASTGSQIDVWYESSESLVPRYVTQFNPLITEITSHLIGSVFSLVDVMCVIMTT